MRYGQLCPLLARMYYIYGHALLRLAELKSDALGGPAAGEEGESDDEDGEEGGAPPAEEDLDAAAEGDEAADDAQVAFENLDVARVIYSRMEPTPVSGRHRRGTPRRRIWLLWEVALETAARLGGGRMRTELRHGSHIDRSPHALTQHLSTHPISATPQANELALAKVHVRLGDAQSENELFVHALDEYNTAFKLFSKNLPQHDR